MRRLVTQMLTVSAVCGAILAALPNQSMAAQASKDAKAFAPDQALTQALAKGDKAAVGTLLDAKFQWVDVSGTIRTKAEALENLAAFAASDKGMGSPTELVTRDYGQVAVLRGIHDKVKFGHICEKFPVLGLARVRLCRHGRARGTRAPLHAAQGDRRGVVREPVQDDALQRRERRHGGREENVDADQDR